MKKKNYNYPSVEVMQIQLNTTILTGSNHLPIGGSIPGEGGD